MLLNQETIRIVGQASIYRSEDKNEADKSTTGKLYNQFRHHDIKG
jgi:hypothetical protein